MPTEIYINKMWIISNYPFPFDLWTEFTSQIWKFQTILIKYCHIFCHTLKLTLCLAYLDLEQLKLPINQKI